MLHVPAPANGFQALQTNFNGARPASPWGTSMTPAVGSKGAWAQAIASLTDDAYGLIVCINNNAASGASRNSVVDIGIGSAGNEIVLIPDIIGGNAASYITPGGGMWYFFPVRIPAGTRVAVRAQGTVTTAFAVAMQTLQEPRDPSVVKAASYVEALGVGTLPQGTSVVAGTTAEGAWTLLGTTAKPCWHWQVGAQITSADLSHNTGAIHIDLAEGDGTNFNRILADAVLHTSTAELHTLINPPAGNGYEVPAGRNIYARAQSSTTAETMFITAYGAGG